MVRVHLSHNFRVLCVTACVIFWAKMCSRMPVFFAAGGRHLWITSRTKKGTQTCPKSRGFLGCFFAKFAHLCARNVLWGSSRCTVGGEKVEIVGAWVCKITWKCLMQRAFFSHAISSFFILTSLYWTFWGAFSHFMESFWAQEIIPRLAGGFKFY